MPSLVNVELHQAVFRQMRDRNNALEKHARGQRPKKKPVLVDNDLITYVAFTTSFSSGIAIETCSRADYENCMLLEAERRECNPYDRLIVNVGDNNNNIDYDDDADEKKYCVEIVYDRGIRGYEKDLFSLRRGPRFKDFPLGKELYQPKPMDMLYKEGLKLKKYLDNYLFQQSFLGGALDIGDLLLSGPAFIFS